MEDKELRILKLERRHPLICTCSIFVSDMWWPSQQRKLLQFYFAKDYGPSLLRDMYMSERRSQILWETASRLFVLPSHKTIYCSSFDFLTVYRLFFYSSPHGPAPPKHTVSQTVPVHLLQCAIVHVHSEFIVPLQMRKVSRSNRRIFPSYIVRH